MCYFATPKTQTDVAKGLSIGFGILMLVVIIGILKNVVDEFVPSEDELSSAAKDTANNQTDAPFAFPVGFSTIYIGVLVTLFPFSAIYHFSEGHNIFHGIWFLLGLPSGELDINPGVRV